MEKIQPNSHKYKREQQEKAAGEKKKVGKVISGTAKIKKKSEARKFADVFIAEDASNVKKFVVEDLLIPGVKKLIVSIIKNSAEMIFGETGDRDRFSTGSRVGYISYDKYARQRDDRRERNTAPRNRFDYDEIIFETRGDAEAARSQMEELIDRYGFCTVADLYDSVQLSAPYTSNKYGWTSLPAICNAEVVRLRDGGYILKLPRIEVLD